MWFKLPDGVDQISVEQQIFREEFSDDKGRYFRAPDHFAPIILGQTGFERVTQPEGAPDDIKAEDPRRGKAMDELADANTALQAEVVQLRQEVKDLTAERDALNTSVSSLESQLDEADKKIAELESAADDPDTKSSSKKKGGD